MLFAVVAPVCVSVGTRACVLLSEAQHTPPQSPHQQSAARCDQGRKYRWGQLARWARLQVQVTWLHACRLNRQGRVQEGAQQAAHRAISQDRAAQGGAGPGPGRPCGC